MQFSSVKNRAEKIIIVGSSWEAVNFRPLEGYSVIAVNSAIEITRGHTDFWFTLDYSNSNLEIMRNKQFRCEYFCAVQEDFQRYMGRRREAIPKDVRYMLRVAGANPIRCNYGLQEDKNKVSTGNSAYGALNLAYHMEPKEIVLLGISGDNKRKFDGKKCYDLSHLPDLFSSAVQQLENKGIVVYNANEDSRLDCFIRKPFSQFV